MSTTQNLAHIGNTLASSLAELDISLSELNALRAINDALLQRCALRLQRKTGGLAQSQTGRIQDVDDAKPDDVQGMLRKTQQVFKSPFYEPKRYPFLEKLRMAEVLRLEQGEKGTARLLEYPGASGQTSVRTELPEPGRAFTVTASEAATLPLSPRKRAVQLSPVKQQFGPVPPTIPIDQASKLVVWGYPIDERMTPYQEACYLFRLLECGASIPADHFTAYRGARAFHGHPMLYIHTISESVTVLILRAFQHYKSRYPPPSKPPFWIRRELGYEDRLKDKRAQIVVNAARQYGYDYRKRDHGAVDVYSNGERVVRLEWQEVQRMEKLIATHDQWYSKVNSIEDLKELINRSEEEFKRTCAEASEVNNSNSSNSTPGRKTPVQQDFTAQSNKSSQHNSSPPVVQTLNSSPPVPRVPQCSPNASSAALDGRPLTDRLFPNGAKDNLLSTISEEQFSPVQLPQHKIRVGKGTPGRLSPVLRKLSTALPSGRPILTENVPIRQSTGSMRLSPQKFGSVGSAGLGEYGIKKEFSMSPGGENVFMRGATPVARDDSPGLCQ